jgi:hypothetical protein
MHCAQPHKERRRAAEWAAVALGVLAAVAACQPAAHAPATPVSHTAAGPVTPTATGAVRGVFRFSTQNWAELKTAGFNAVTDGGVQEYGAAQATAGLSGSVWLDAYDNRTCRQLLTGAQITAGVQANVTAGRTSLYYELGDEPTSYGCRAEAAYRAMTAAVHRADKGARTWTVDDQFNDPDMSTWPRGVPMAGTVDVLAFDVYPCYYPVTASCDFAMIRGAAARIRAAQLRQPWWFVLQDFNRDGGDWRWPAPAELARQYAAWQGAGASGYFVYAWDADGSVTGQPGNVTTLRRLNADPCC